MYVYDKQGDSFDICGDVWDSDYGAMFHFFYFVLNIVIHLPDSLKLITGL